MNQGWECPRCKIINAPFVVQCSNIRCVPITFTITTDGTGTIAGENIFDKASISLQSNHGICSCPNCVPEKYGKKLSSAD